MDDPGDFDDDMLGDTEFSCGCVLTCTTQDDMNVLTLKACTPMCTIVQQLLQEADEQDKPVEIRG